MSHRAKLSAEIYSTAGKSVLKLRAFEMVLMLFYVEDLKRAVVESIRSTPRTAAQLPDGIKDLHKKAWKVLVRDNIITETEREDVEQLIEYRNVIAHQVHHLTSDVGEFAEGIHPKYKPDALASLAKYRKKIIDRLAGRYVLSLSFRGLLFQTAEKTYKEELKRLRRKVGKQVAKAKREIDRANTAMRAIPTALRDEFVPWTSAAFDAKWFALKEWSQVLQALVRCRCHVVGGRTYDGSVSGNGQKASSGMGTRIPAAHGCHELRASSLN